MSLVNPANANPAHDRLYQDLARKLIAQISGGDYAVGDRLPAERELSATYNVSRPTVREAMIALEVQGVVEVKIGSGAYVKAIPGQHDQPGFNITAFELAEARMLFEGEAAALAASLITPDELDEMVTLLAIIEMENQGAGVTGKAEEADRAFHLAIARASRNAAIVETVGRLWDLREVSPESALLHQRARAANIKPVVNQHAAILEALRAGDPAAARNAMRGHLSAVLDSLLFATEERAVEEARLAVQAKRERYTRATS
jgi:GntR family hexuronate regulon transcriptional repressor